MRISFVLAFVPMILAAGCGGSPGDASVSGTINGKSFSNASSISSNTAGQTSAVIIISNVSDLCARVVSNDEPTNVQALTFSLVEVNDANEVSAPAHTGDYALLSESTKSGQFFSAGYDAIGATTSDTTDENATDGTVTLTSFADDKYAGTFDLFFGTDHVTGTFDPTACAGIKP
ncbi:MAG TPA: hypothetical protein VIA18_11400 [Polyangia bacterium]|jgi:hypothetical protein|nr:hypothetical protein [Polyangia bacterium]